MLIENTLFGTTDKVADAIKCLKLMEPEEGYWLAFSGGKDSVVIKALADMAGVKYEAHYTVTSVDPPELVRFVKGKYPDVSIDIPHDKEGKPLTMWNLIPKKNMPPTRLVRYCCKALKESAGEHRLTITGVRWAESSARKNNQGIVTVFNPTKEMQGERTDRGGIIVNNDNDEARELVEACYKWRKVIVNPIISWDDEDVWEFIHKYNIPYCDLYNRGYKRLGCIGCPMSTHAEEELEKYPKYKANYLKAFKRMLDNAAKNGISTKWKTPEEVYDWWLRKDKPQNKDQIEMSLENGKANIPVRADL